MEKSFFFSDTNIVSFLACILASLAMDSKQRIRTDEDTLLALKDHITFDPNQILFKNWSTGSAICDWIGVACGLRHMRVTSLDISNMGFNGTIVPQLGNLSFLVSLNLGGNNFSGHIPQELAHLRRLKLLDFSFNELTGEIPSRVIGSLNQLEYLYLNNNSLSGSIPSSIFNLTFLKELICYQNELSGSIPFEIFNISSLEKLSLSFNHLSGNLPTFMCHNLQELEMNTLWSNKLLSGPLPSDMSRCSQLRYIDMSVNNFSGTLPKDLGSMKMLEVAYFGYNILECKSTCISVSK